MGKRRGAAEKRRWRMQDELSSFYNRKAKRLDKRCRKTVKCNHKGWGGWRTSRPGGTFPPTQRPMGRLCSCGDGRVVVLIFSYRISLGKRLQNSFRLQQLHPP